MKLDKAKTVAATQSALATRLSGCSHHAGPNVKAIYLFILKAFCITSLLGWLFIACPAAVADEFKSSDLSTPNFEQTVVIKPLNTGWKTTIGTQYDASWVQQNAGDYKSVDGLHAGVKRLRQILSAWRASNPNRSSLTAQVKSMMTAKGDGRYAAWSYNIGASSKALEINIRYEF
ncbi:MAG: hypothetical protein ACR2PS_05360 [Pseudomonadales bacterium]